MPAEINATLQQQGRVGPIREFQIINGKEIRIIQGLPPRQQVYTISLLALADKSQLRVHVAWRWIWLLGLSVAALLGYSLLKYGFETSLGVYEFSYVVAFSLLGILSLVMFILNLARKRVFISRHSKIPLFDILISNPDYKSYKSFLNALDGYLAKAREFWNLKMEHQIAGEIRMLRRLSSEGVISQGAYNQAKDKLFSLSSKKSRVNT